MINQSQHTSLSQTMAQMRRRYNTRSTGGSDTPYNGYDPSPSPSPSGMPPVADAGSNQIEALKTMDNPKTGMKETKAVFRFNGSGSHDPDDGTGPGEGITNYSWSFPGGNPNHIEGETKSAVSTEYTTVGDKIVTLTVTDNDDPAESSAATVTATVAKITPVLTPKDNFAGRSNSRFGIREPITLSYTIEPSGVTAADLGGLKWEIESGGGTLTPIRKKPGHYSYIAPDTPGTVKLKLEIERGPSAGVVRTQKIEVVKPTGRLERVPNTPIGHLHNVFSVGFTAFIYLGPKDVSFSHLQFREGKADPDSISGYFDRHLSLKERKHPEGSWQAIGTGNITTGCKAVIDRVGVKMLPRDWSPGELTWLIPWEVGWQTQKVGDDGVTHISMEASEFKKAFSRVFSLDHTGTAHIQKDREGPFSAPLRAPTVRPDDAWPQW